MGEQQENLFLCIRCGARTGLILPNMLIEKEVFIPKRAPSQNDFHGRHWRTYYEKYRKEWGTVLYLLVRHGKDNGGLRIVSITAYQKNKQACYDYSNLEGGCKPIIDGLKALGWFKDDKEQFLVDIYTQKILGSDNIKEVGIKLRIYKQITDYPTGEFCYRCGANALYQAQIGLLERRNEEIK